MTADGALASSDGRYDGWSGEDSVISILEHTAAAGRWQDAECISGFEREIKRIDGKQRDRALRAHGWAR